MRPIDFYLLTPELPVTGLVTWRCTVDAAIHAHLVDIRDEGRAWEAFGCPGCGDVKLAIALPATEYVLLDYDRHILSRQ